VYFSCFTYCLFLLVFLLPYRIYGEIKLYITLVAGERLSLLMVENNDEVYDKKPQRYAEDNVTQW